MTALTTKDPNSSACQPEAHQEPPRESKKTREKKQHKLRVCDKNNTSAASAFGTILRANILPGLPISQDFQILRHSFSLSLFLSFFTPFFLSGSPICSLSLLLVLLLLLILLDDDDSSHKQNRRSKEQVLESSRGKSRRKDSSSYSCFASFPLLLLSSVVFFTSVVRA
jgi:hypothetical protein